MKLSPALLAASFAALSAVSAPTCSARGAEPADSASRARPRFVIVLGEKAADPEKFAAEFLAERLRRDLGAEASIGAAAPAGGDSRAIIIGTPDSNPALGKFKADLSGEKDRPDPEGFLVTTDGGATVLVGASPRAVVYGAARLLSERGWRFCSLHELGEVSARGAEMPSGPIKDRPALRVRALAADSVGLAAPRHLDWMAANGLNRLVLLVEKTGLEPVAALARESARRGIDLELSAPDAWWRAMAGLKGGEQPEEAAAAVAAAHKRLAERFAGVRTSSLEATWGGELRESPLGAPFAGPRGPLHAISERFAAAGEKPYAAILACAPRRFFLDESSLPACYFAACAWKGAAVPADGFVRDYCRRYYGPEAGDELAEVFLGFEAMDKELSKPADALTDESFTAWRLLAERYRNARTKAPANTPARKRLALQYRGVLDHHQSCLESGRMLRKAESVADPAEKRRLLLDTIRFAWDYNRRKESRLFEMNPGDAYAFCDASGRAPELEGELATLLKARALLLAGEDGSVPAGLAAAALAEGGGGKLSVTNLAQELGDNKPANFADGKPDTATVLGPLPGGRFTLDFGKEVTVSRVRFLGTPERPLTRVRVLAVDALGATTTLAEASCDAPGMFVAQELAFPAARVRALVFEAGRFERARQDAHGPALAELEAYEK